MPLRRLPARLTKAESSATRSRMPSERRWTTRIIVLPDAPLVVRGPYRWVNHPNYVVVIAEIAVLPLVFGLWLVVDLEFVKWGDAWVIIALVLWVLANALGGIGGRREKTTRELAERLAAEGDAPSAELRARMRDPVTLALSWGSGVVVLAILAVMIWKPGH